MVSNALKYTIKGSIEIGSALAEKNVEFHVTDTGIGIPGSEIDRIFDAFYRGEQALSLAIRGSGLRLCIANELVKLLGGSIRVDSTPEKGSHFCFSIPYESSPDKMPENIQTKKNLMELKDFAVLVADDEIINFQYLEILLKK